MYYASYAQKLALFHFKKNRPHGYPIREMDFRMVDKTGENRSSIEFSVRGLGSRSRGKKTGLSTKHTTIILEVSWNHHKQPPNSALSDLTLDKSRGRRQGQGPVQNIRVLLTSKLASK
jgi:hypothetical protein